jgi:hypothetical protein
MNENHVISGCRSHSLFLKEGECGAGRLHSIPNGAPKTRHKCSLTAMGLLDASLENHGSLFDPARGDYADVCFHVVEFSSPNTWSAKSASALDFSCRFLSRITFGTYCR